jgi:hypothetical protein
LAAVVAVVHGAAAAAVPVATLPRVDLQLQLLHLTTSLSAVVVPVRQEALITVAGATGGTPVSIPSPLWVVVVVA